MATTEIAVQQELFAPLELAAGLPAGTLTTTGLNLGDANISTISWEDFERLGRGLGMVERAAPWLIGDWINFGEAVFGEDHAQAVEGTRAERYDLANRVTGLDPDTLKNYASLCGRIARERRREELKFRTHGPVASLDPDEQSEWLERAVVNAWGRDELAQAIRDEKNPPVATTADGNEVLPPLSIRERLEAAASLVLAQAQSTSDGSYLVPAEPIVQLREAMGQE